MSENETDVFADLTGPVREAHALFLERIEPHRAELFRYARAMTPSVWDAEDLVQETLLKAFARLGRFATDVRDARAYLFRMATNAWLSEQRRRRPDLVDTPEPAGGSLHELAPEVREALERLASALPPRERVAVLLKDAFGFRLRDIAGLTGSTVGAVKSALHRGRGRLAGAHAPAAEAPAPPSALVDAFVAAFNSRDVDRLLALLAPEARTEIVGVYHGRGESAARNVAERTWEEAALVRAEAARGPVAVLYYREGDGEAIGDLVRVEGAGDRVTRTRWYYYCPDVLREVGTRLGAAVRTQGYRHRGA